MHFYDNGAIKKGYVSEKDVRLTIGPNEITFKGDQIMEFYEDGGIKEGIMAHDAVLKIGNKKLPFQGGHGNPISTFPNGNIRSGYFAEDLSLQMGERLISFRKHWGMSFYENGSVNSGTIKNQKR